MLDHLDGDMDWPFGQDEVEVFGQTEEEIFGPNEDFGLLEPTFMGETSEQVYGVQEDLFDLNPTFNDGSMLSMRDMGFIGLGGPTIQEFVKNKDAKAEYQGDNTIKLAYDGTWVELRIPPGYKSATFTWYQDYKKYKKNWRGQRGDKVKEGTDGPTTHTLTTGQTRRFTNHEGWKDEKGLFQDYWYDRDTYITLDKAVRIVKETDPNTGKEVTKTETQYSAQEASGGVPGGAGIPGLGLNPDALKWGALGLVVIAGLAGTAYYYYAKRKSPTDPKVVDGKVVA